MKNIFYLFFVTFFIAFSACERERNINLDIPYEGIRLELYAPIGEQQPIAILLHRTLPVLAEDLNFKVIDGIVKLFENGILVEQLRYDAQQDRYISPSDFRPSATKMYHIEASALGTSIVSERVGFLPKVFIQSHTLQIDSANNRAVVTVSFQDILQYKNFYSIYQKKYYNDTLLKPTTFDYQVDYRADFKDSLFAGSRYDFETDFYLLEAIYGANYNLLGVKKINQLKVELYSFSEGAYQYPFTLGSSGSSVGGQFSDRLPPWSNVRGGYGAIFTYTLDTLTLRW